MPATCFVLVNSINSPYLQNTERANNLPEDPTASCCWIPKSGYGTPCLLACVCSTFLPSRAGQMLPFGEQIPAPWLVPWFTDVPQCLKQTKNWLEYSLVKRKYDGLVQVQRTKITRHCLAWGRCVVRCPGDAVPILVCEWCSLELSSAQPAHPPMATVAWHTNAYCCPRP